jgi:hypothetical protein
LAVLLCGGLAVTVLLVALRHTGHVVAGPASGRTTATHGTGHPGDLRSYLIPRPQGAQTRSNALTVDGALNLDQASQMSINSPPDESDLLSANGFRRGAISFWTTSDGTDVVIELLQFDSSNGAINYFAQETAEVQRKAPPQDAHLLEEIPAGLTIVVPDPDRDGSYLTASYAERGDVTMLIMTRRKHAPAGLSAVNQLLAQQYNRL